MGKKDIHVIYGRQARLMVKTLLEKMQLAEQLQPDMKIALKPNLVVARPATEGATTSPQLVAGIIEYLQEHGLRHISIMEGSWVGADTRQAFSVCGYEEISQKYGAPLYDLKADRTVVKKVGELELRLCQKPVEADFLINLPVLKAHCQTAMTCALKNLKGCLPDSEKRRFHSLGLQKPIGYLGKALPVGLTIVDALNGDLTFEEGGNPVAMDRIFAGEDPVLLDAYAAELLGYAASDIPYIGIAEGLGAGTADLSQAILHEYEMEQKKEGQFRPSRQAQRLAKNIEAKEACSACYGSLIHALQRLSEEGVLQRLPGTLYIGQGFRGQEGQGIGIGQCASGFGTSLPGCPPTARSMVGFLTQQLRRR